MYDHQAGLRKAAHQALENRGYGIESERYAGARLELRKGNAVTAAAIRTSANRRVGWMRKETGEWRGMSNVDVIVVAAFDAVVKPTKVEVFGFDPKKVRSVFNERLKHNLSKNPKFLDGAPVFVFLDPQPGKAAEGTNLRKHALWKEEIPTGDVGQPQTDSPAGGDERPLTIAMAKEGLAKTYGVSPEAVEITIRG